jgi:hypothetical protein
MAPKRPKLYARTVQSAMNVIWDAPIEYMFGREDETNGDTPYINILKKYNHARDMALKGGYDALWTVEADMIVPPITLERLTRVEADVAYGLYASRHGHRRWLAFFDIAETYGVSVSDDVINAREAWGQVIETQGVGLGCTLIWRHVLEEIPFRCPSEEVANDWYFSLDCKTKGFVQKHDLGVVCGHIIGPPSPKIVWPDPDHPRLTRIEFFEEAPPERIPFGQQIEVTIDRLETKAVYAE